MKRLFVGGPWHGRVVELPDDRDVWVVPVPRPLSAMMLREPVQVLTDPPETATYRRMAFTEGRNLREVMVAGAQSSGRVFDALWKAAELQ